MHCNDLKSGTQIASLPGAYHDRVMVTRGVTVSTSAFLACHQCHSAGSSLAWGLNFRALVCGIF